MRMETYAALCINLGHLVDVSVFKRISIDYMSAPARERVSAKYWKQLIEQWEVGDVDVDDIS